MTRFQEINRLAYILAFIYFSSKNYLQTFRAFRTLRKMGKDTVVISFEEVISANIVIFI